MIENVLKEVREAESRADAIQKEAYQKGKEIVSEAEAKAEAQKKSAAQTCKAERAAALQEARRIANERTNAILKSGEEQATELADSKNSAIEECADKIVSVLFEKYIAE